MDLARSIQDVTEEVMLRLARTLHRETGTEHLCLAGGVALNCVGNGRSSARGPFPEPLDPARRAAMPAGALGVALVRLAPPGRASPRSRDGRRDGMRGGLLGPAYSNEEIERFLTGTNAPYVRVRDDDAVRADGATTSRRARSSAGSRAGWSSARGRSERRSILGDARQPDRCSRS